MELVAIDPSGNWMYVRIETELKVKRYKTHPTYAEWVLSVLVHELLCYAITKEDGTRSIGSGQIHVFTVKTVSLDTEHRYKNGWFSRLTFGKSTRCNLPGKYFILERHLMLSTTACFWISCTSLYDKPSIAKATCFIDILCYYVCVKRYKTHPTCVEWVLSVFRPSFAPRAISSFPPWINQAHLELLQIWLCSLRVSLLI